jgi:hypothetical protein
VPYLDLVKESFEVARRNRYLWFYGLFAGGTGFNFQASFPTGSGDGSVDPSPSISPGVVVGIAVAVVVLALVFVLLSTVSQGALADSVAAIRRGERRNFGGAWRAGLANFWRVLGFGLLLGLIFVGAVLVIAVPVAAVITAVVLASGSVAAIIVAAIALGFPALIVLIAAVLALGVLGQLGIRHVVLARGRIVESLRYGWGLLRHNFIPSGAMLLIQQIATFLGTIAIVLPVLLLSLPAIVLLVAGATEVGIGVAVLTAFVVIPLALTAYGALGTFNHSLWTLTYLELTRRGWDSNPRSA